MTGRERAWRWQWAVRLAGAALLLWTAWAHRHLYDLGYATVPRIGPLFLLDAVLAVLAAAALLAAPRRLLPPAELAGGLLLAGTLAGLVLSTTTGLLGLEETWDAPLAGRSAAVEGAGAVLLVGAALLHGLPGRRRAR